MKLYVSGPIAGVADATFSFSRFAALLAKAGHEPLNPYDCAPICVGEDCRGQFDGHDFECWLRGDIIEMLRCDGLAMLPGWERSRGARLEHFVALQTGLIVKEAEQWLV